MLLLETLVTRNEGFRLTELSEQFSLNKITLHGLLAILSSLGYVSRRGQYYIAGLRLRDIALPLTETDQQLRAHFTPRTAQADCAQQRNLLAGCTLLYT